MIGNFLKSFGLNSFTKQESQFDDLLLSIEQYALSTEKYICAGQELSFANSSDYQQLKKLNSADKLEVLHVLVQKISSTEFFDDLGFKSYLVDIHLLSKLLRFRLQFPSGYSFLGLFNQLYKPNKCYALELTIPDRPFGHFVKQIESHVKLHGLDPTTSADINALISHPTLSQYTVQGIGKEYWGPDIGKAMNKLETLLFLHDKQLTPPYVLDGGALASILNKSLAELNFQEQNKWHVIFNHLSTASASKPNKSFMQAAELIIAQIGNDRYQAQVLEWITAIAKLKVPVEAGSAFIEQQYVDLLKGMLWTLSLYQDPKTLQAVDELVVVCFKKIIGKGAAAPSVGNAGIYVLAQADGVTGIKHLSKLKLNIRQNNTHKLIQKYIEKKATSVGMSTAQIEELSVPTFGLVNGKLNIDFAQYQLTIAISNVGKLETHWLTAKGRIQKTVPERVKNNDIFIEKLKVVRALCKQIKQTLSVQKNRLDRLYSENMQWTLSSFTKTYLEHGLLSQIANKIIWKVDDNPAMFVANTWQDVQGQTVEFSQDAKVQLWHPLYSDNSIVTAWQKQLAKMQIQQPFKQVYREVYHVTEPDISGQLSSNRLATHILKQHQLQTLAIAKGWSFKLLTAMGDRTGRGEVTKTFAEYNLTVKFFVNEPTTSGVAINESWIWQYVVTDDIQFFNENAECVNLKTVPAILISEVFRDMNFFVDVASIASEPLWTDDKAEKLQGYKDYWHLYSFGKLTNMAKSRKAMLENLLPHLTLSSHFAIEGNFLVIQGKMHSYKIHIGSAQILNKSNDQVLYFEPRKIALKFKRNTDSLLDMDSMSLAILSKAYALVDDDKIKFPSFLNQLSEF